jgi:hypothetical protein
MENVYSFVDVVQSIPGKLQLLEDIIGKILQQTVECAIFIREYTGHGFVGKGRPLYAKVVGFDMVCSESHETGILGYRPNC